MNRLTVTPAVAAATRALALASTLLLCSAPAQAAAPLREDARPHADCALSLNVQTYPFTVAEHFDRSFSQMVEIANSDSDDPPVPRGEGSVGNTFVALSANNQMSWDADGCGTLNITVGYTHATVYVARELNRDECAREHVLAHERHHVALYRRALDTLAARTHAKLAPLVAPLSTASLTPKNVEMLLSEALSEAATVMPEHAAFDSDEEYARNQTACGGAIARLYRRATGPRLRS